MDTNVEDLVGDVLLRLQEEGAALLKFQLQRLHRFHISDGALGNFLPKQFCVVKKKLNVKLLVADDLNLLIELFSQLEALHDKGLSVLAEQLGVLGELDREGGLEDQNCAYRKLKSQVDLGGVLLTFRFVVEHSRAAVIVGLSSGAQPNQHLEGRVEESLAIFKLLEAEEEIESLNDRFLDQINISGIPLAHHVDFKRLGTLSFKIGDLCYHEQCSRVGVLILEDACVKGDLLCQVFGACELAPFEKLLGVVKPRFMNPKHLNHEWFKRVSNAELYDFTGAQVVFRVLQSFYFLVVDPLFIFSELVGRLLSFILEHLALFLKSQVEEGSASLEHVGFLRNRVSKDLLREEFEHAENRHELNVEVVLLKQLRHLLNMHVGQLWLDEGVLGNHDLVFVLVGDFVVLGGQLVRDPVFWLLGQAVLKRDLHLASIDDLGDELSPTPLVVCLVAERLELCLVLLEEGLCVECEHRLLPHLHDEVVAVQGVLTLLLRICCQHCKHGVDPDHLVKVRTVHVERLAVLFLSFLKCSRRLFRDTRTLTLNAPTPHSGLRDSTFASYGLLDAFRVRLASWRL